MVMNEVPFPQCTRTAGCTRFLRHSGGCFTVHRDGRITHLPGGVTVQLSGPTTNYLTQGQIQDDGTLPPLRFTLSPSHDELVAEATLAKARIKELEGRLALARELAIKTANREGWCREGLNDALLQLDLEPVSDQIEINMTIAFKHRDFDNFAGFDTGVMQDELIAAAIAVGIDHGLIYVDGSGALGHTVTETEEFD